MRNIFLFCGFIILFGCGNDVVQSPQTETEQEQNHPRAGKVALGPLEDVTVSLRRTDAADSVDMRPATIQVVLSDTLPRPEIVYVTIRNKTAGLRKRISFSVGDTIEQFQFEDFDLELIEWKYEGIWNSNPPYSVKVHSTVNYSRVSYTYLDTLCIYGTDCDFEVPKPRPSPDYSSSGSSGSGSDDSDDSGDVEIADPPETTGTGGGSGGSGGSTPTVDNNEPRWATITRKPGGGSNWYRLTIDRPFDHDKSIGIWSSREILGNNLVLYNGRCVNQKPSPWGQDYRVGEPGHSRNREVCGSSADIKDSSVKCFWPPNKPHQPLSGHIECVVIPAGETFTDFRAALSSSFFYYVPHTIWVRDTPGVMNRQIYRED